MTIESTLGHFELSGKQDIHMNMEYYLKIPWSVIKQGARYTLSGKNKAQDEKQGEDEIIRADPNKKTRYLNLKIKGNIDDYKISLGKDRNKSTRLKR
jgi:hypothetical protein